MKVRARTSVIYLPSVLLSSIWSGAGKDDVAVNTGFGGIFGFCIRDGLGGNGGGGTLLCDMEERSSVEEGRTRTLADGECVSMIFSICAKHVRIAEINAEYCFGWDTMAKLTCQG